ncbi:MAG: N-acetyl-gamma-glutamyl-phosphate reductase [Planctomycetes bacterium]|nr:N-acetyl-gamma-glutamyl-phosphate reductase [Planctomycetota bacterium]
MATKVGIIGATGYNGLELIKILLRHGDARLAYLATRSTQRPLISSVHPSLLGLCNDRAEHIDLDKIAERSDVVFLGVPHTAAMEYVPGLLERNVKVIDLSADYRLKNAKTYQKWYNHEHTDEGNLARAVYGLPEIFADEIREADLVANPGCYPTAVILGAYPLIAEGLVEAAFIADAKSGVTGAGKKLTAATHFPEANESVLPYKVGAHQHSPEMVDVLSQTTGKEVKVEFVPHLVPMDRGIEATMYFTPAGGSDAQDVAATFQKHYAEEPFVRLRGSSFARTRDVSFTNFCDIAWTATDAHVIVSTSIDNLIKGAAGQAVENMNIMFGHERTEGLL